MNTTPRELSQQVNSSLLSRAQPYVYALIIRYTMRLSGLCDDMFHFCHGTVARGNHEEGYCHDIPDRQDNRQKNMNVIMLYSSRLDYPKIQDRGHVFINEHICTSCHQQRQYISRSYANILHL